MSGGYDLGLVALSLVVAIAASYTALELAGRVSDSRGKPSWGWLAGGALSMGSGIWSMHFIGMLAFQLPVAVAYDAANTALSLAIAVAVSGLALFVVRGPTLTPRHMTVGATLMGIGISAMHYTGMNAMRMSPAIEYRPSLFAASVAIAMAASLAALWIAFRLRRKGFGVAFVAKLGSATLMGFAIAGMHYTGMAAAHFAPGSICLAVDATGGMQSHVLAMAIGITTMCILAITLWLAALEPKRNIRWKLAGAFIAVGCFVAAFVALAISIHSSTIERAAQLEAEHVAELIADAAVENHGSARHLQEYVGRLNLARKRDVVILDAARRIIADSDPAEVGQIFAHDPGNDVAKTIADGLTRTFIEKNEFHPDGARQIVVPMRRTAPVLGESPVGAVILEYTAIRETLFAAERHRMYVMTGVGILVVVLATLFGLGIARRIVQPLLDLKASVERIASHDYGVRVAITSQDEVGLLASAFNKMAEDLNASHAEVIEHERQLETRVAVRTDELNQSNALLQLEVGQRSWEASHDVLTGLANRREFERLVDVSVGTACTADKHHVVCYMDLDQFKVVNDTSGHAAGDDLLKEIAALLQSRIRRSDTLARLGGDEFGLLLEGCPLARAQLIAADLLAAVRDFRFNRDGKIFSVGVSIGVAAVTGESASSAEVISRADVACYWAKEQGRNRVCVYRTGDSDMALRRREMGWIARINAALAEGRFTLYQQSYLQLSGEGDPRTHLEVLIRMIDEDGSLVQPGSFLPAAERYNLMPAVDRWVIGTVFARYHALVAERGGGPLTCAINLSGTSLNAEGFLDFIKQKAVEHAMPPLSICFEITETAAVNNLRAAAEFIRECKLLGFLFALDDFGTGTSSFGYLKNLPVDYLKIDGGFVKNLERDAVDKAMTETINRIGHIMGIKTVAEYAENDAIIRELRVMGVDYAQGFGICRPTPLFAPAPLVDPLAPTLVELKAA